MPQSPTFTSVTGKKSGTHSVHFNGDNKVEAFLWMGSAGNTVTTDGVTGQVKGRRNSNWAPSSLPAAGICLFAPSSIPLFMKPIRCGEPGELTD